ncbi:unnamed protein product [Polarella glacialis]|uniref:Methionyl/Leucyl tRNA synthetase domain-containing protein n=1 Tax=Polarella glacialis TaxID=89957 RepID=A0A813FI85_POLGL|nr:unnamed protein product [Polarella glacialis]
MGKSLGNVVEPLPLVDAFGADAVRFFFASCMNFGEDGDFSYEVFIKRVNSSLANELGNLVHRILTLCRKNLAKASSPLELLSASGKTREAAEEELAAHPVRCEALKACAASAACYECLDFPKAAEAALRIAGAANLRMTVIEPWAKLKKDSSAEGKETALRETTKTKTTTTTTTTPATTTTTTKTTTTTTTATTTTATATTTTSTQQTKGRG